MATQDSRPHPSIEVNAAVYLFSSHSWAAANAMLRSMITANDRYSGNNRYSGIKSPDRFFHYSGRCLYFEIDANS